MKRVWLGGGTYLEFSENRWIASILIDHRKALDWWNSFASLPAVTFTLTSTFNRPPQKNFSPPLSFFHQRILSNLRVPRSCRAKTPAEMAAVYGESGDETGHVHGGDGDA